MDIIFSENNSNCILCPISDEVSLELVLRMEEILKGLPINKSLALNLKNIGVICVEFLDFLKEFSPQKQISLFNLQSEVFVVLNLTKYDKFANIYLSDIDFNERKREMLNRRFSLL